MKIKSLLKETFKGGERKGKEKFSQLCTNMQESHLAYLQFLSRLIFLSKRVPHLDEPNVMPTFEVFIICFINRKVLRCKDQLLNYLENLPLDFNLFNQKRECKHFYTSMYS